MKFDKAMKDLIKAVQNAQLEIPLEATEPGKTLFETIAILIFSAGKLKLVKKPLKTVLLILQTNHREDLQNCIAQKFDEILHGSVPCAAISFLLEDCRYLHPLLSPYIGRIVRRTNEDLQLSTNEKNFKTYDQDSLCLQLKAVLQILQFLQDDVEKVFKDNTKTSCHLLEISQSCIKILAHAKVYGDAIRAMAGIYLGNFLNYVGKDIDIASIVCNMCEKNMLETSSQLPVCGVLATLNSFEFTGNKNYSFLVFLLKGLFSCTRSSVFFVRLSDKGTLLHILFQFICEASELQEELQYHSLQVLKLWWIKARCALKQSEYAVMIHDEGTKESVFVNVTLQLLIRQWDSPISGTSAIVLNILTVLVDTTQIMGGKEKILNNLLDKLMILPMSIKGKYGFITLLISKMGAKIILEKYPYFLHNMKPLLAVNHLFPVISKTYKAIVADVGKEQENQLWRTILLPGLVDALFDSSHLIRSNAAIHWLPIHLQSFHGCYQDIMCAINENATTTQKNVDLKYLALMAASKCARKEHFIKFCDLDCNLMNVGLTNFDDAIRSEAFQILCCNAKSSERVTKQEIDLMQIFLPLNMNSDSAVFRQQLVYCIRCFVERLRDSVYPAIKESLSSENTDATSYVEHCQDTFWFLLRTSINSIHPEFSYQRKKTGIDIFEVLLNAFGDYRKAIPFTEILFKDQNCIVLTEMLLDSVPEIRSSASSLIRRFFTNLPAYCSSKYLSIAYRLCRSPRAQDNESAAALLEVILLQKNPLYCANMLENCVAQLEQDFNIMRTNVIRSSYEAPAHGWLLVLDRIIHSLGSDFMLHHSHLLVANICDTVCELMNFTLVTIFGCPPQNGAITQQYLGTSADFCEITERIEIMTLREGRSHDGTLLSDDHEVILASFWLCLLRGSSLLAKIAAIIEKTYDAEELLTNISSNMVLILTSCRHRGAIEGCYEAFLVVCKTLIGSKVERYREIPHDIIMTICSSLQTVAGSNVTRRSAGIPLVVEAVLVAEVSCKSSKLFSFVLSNIMELSKQVPTLITSEHENFDFPQVHGLYILKHLFRNTQLGSSVLNSAASVLEISIKCLSSTIWVVRNAATHLFGAVANRMLGQKNIDGSHIESLDNSASSSSFFRRYPTIGGILLKEMKKSLPSSALPNPGLHPMLCLLSKLVYCADEEDLIPNGLVETVTMFLDSPVYSVRRVAAKSIMGLVKDKMAYISTLLDGMAERLKNSNALHGLLIFIHGALNVDERVSESKFVFLKLFSMWKTTPLHPINDCISIQILRSYRSFLAENASAFLETPKRTPQVGTDESKYEYIKTKLELCTKNEVKILLSKCNSNENSAVLKSIIEWMPECKWKADLMIQLIECLQVRNQQFPNGIIEIITKYCDACAILSGVSEETKKWLYKISLSSLSQDKALSLQCSGLRLFSFVLRAYCTLQTDNTDANFKHMEKGVTEWIYYISSRTSNSMASEPLRLSAAEALDIVGCRVFRLLVTRKKELGSFVCTVLSLLHDEQRDIRRHTCSFVLKLVGSTEQGSIYHTSATEKFLHYFFTEAPFTEGAVDTIFMKVFKLKEELSPKHQSVLFNSEPFNVYEEPLEIAQSVVNAFKDSNMMKSASDRCLTRMSEQLIEKVKRNFHKDNNLVHDLIHLKCLQMAMQCTNAMTAGRNCEFFTFIKKVSEDESCQAILNQEIDYTIRIWKGCGTAVPK